MIAYPQIDPVAFSLGPVQLHWYGLMYVVGLTAAWWLGRRRAHRLGLTHDDIGDLTSMALWASSSGAAWALCCSMGSISC